MQRNKDSCLLYVSSHHATAADYAAGKFSFNIPNSMFVDSVARLAPVSATVPNMFENINTRLQNHTFTSQLGVDPIDIAVIPLQQYNLTDYLAALTAVAPNFTFTVETNGHVSINETGDDDPVVSGTIEFWHTLGFDESQLTNAGGSQWQLQLINLSTITANNLPNLGGDKMLWIAIDHGAHGNVTSAFDGMQYDGLIPVDLTTTDYGQSANFICPHLDIFNVEFKYSNALKTFDVELLDYKFRALPLPANYSFQLVLKIFHMEN